MSLFVFDDQPASAIPKRPQVTTTRKQRDVELAIRKEMGRGGKRKRSDKMGRRDGHDGRNHRDLAPAKIQICRLIGNQIFLHRS